MTTTRPPERRIVTNFSAEGKSHREQLQSMADDILKHMRSNMTDPRQLKLYADSFKVLRDLLEDELPTEHKKQEVPVDLSKFED